MFRYKEFWKEKQLKALLNHFIQKLLNIDNRYPPQSQEGIMQETDRLTFDYWFF